jgi:competence protein ComEA
VTASIAAARGLVALLGLMALASATPALADKKPLPPGERIDLNRASVAELMRLPGVGKKRALAIVGHREKHPFRRPEDILQVKGMSAGWLARVKGNLTVGDAPPRAAEPARAAAR